MKKEKIITYKGFESSAPIEPTYEGLQVRPLRIRVYFLGLIKRGGVVLNVPSRGSREFINDYLESKGFNMLYHTFKASIYEVKK